MTMSVPVRRRVPRGRGVFSQTPQTSALGRRRLRPGDNVRMRAGDNVCAHASMGAAWEGFFFTNIPNFSARATTSVSGRQHPHARGQQCMRVGNNACTWATTSAHVRRRVLCGRSVFSQTPQTSALGQRRLRPGDNACVRATTSALAPRRLDPGFETFAFFRALAIQTKLFHYLFLKITGNVLKMVIQSYSY